MPIPIVSTREDLQGSGVTKKKSGFHLYESVPYWRMWRIKEIMTYNGSLLERMTEVFVFFCSREGLSA